MTRRAESEEDRSNPRSTQPSAIPAQARNPFTLLVAVVYRHRRPRRGQSVTPAFVSARDAERWPRSARGFSASFAVASRSEQARNLNELAGAGLSITECACRPEASNACRASAQTASVVRSGFRHAASLSHTPIGWPAMGLEGFELQQPKRLRSVHPRSGAIGISSSSMSAASIANRTKHDRASATAPGPPGH